MLPVQLGSSASETPSPYKGQLGGKVKENVWTEDFALTHCSINTATEQFRYGPPGLGLPQELQSNLASLT